MTVATNSPHVAASLFGRPGLELLMIGGRVDPRSGAALGARALRELGDLRVDLAFLGACAVDAQAGVAAFDAEEAEFKRLLVARAKRVATAATSDKLGTMAPFAVAPLERLTQLVVEAMRPRRRSRPSGFRASPDPRRRGRSMKRVRSPRAARRLAAARRHHGGVLLQRL